MAEDLKPLQAFLCVSFVLMHFRKVFIFYINQKCFLYLGLQLLQRQRVFTKLADVGEYALHGMAPVQSLLKSTAVFPLTSVYFASYPWGKILPLLVT